MGVSCKVWDVEKIKKNNISGAFFHLHVDAVLAVLLPQSTHGLGQVSLLDDGIMAELSYCLVLILHLPFELTCPLYIHSQIAQLLLKRSDKQVKETRISSGIE